VFSIERSDPLYPPEFENLRPEVDKLYAIGDASLLATPMVSIVGTRDATSYGLRVTREIATELARGGITIVSGMARGIDGVAHRAALDCGGKTIAVMGTGVDVPYPRSHRELHRSVGDKGLVISEQAPGSPAYQGSFPKRNRIIAALGRCTIVVEAGFKSGANSTARECQRLDRTVAAVPGPIDSPQSAGTNLLLRDGAVMISSVADALSLAGVTGVAQRPPASLEGNDALVWSALGPETIPLDSLAQKTQLSTRECLYAVTSLELAGMVECLVTGEVRRR
jgi:DNA processing protein